MAWEYGDTLGIKRGPDLRPSIHYYRTDQQATRAFSDRTHSVGRSQSKKKKKADQEATKRETGKGRRRRMRRGKRRGTHHSIALHCTEEKSSDRLELLDASQAIAVH